MVDTAKLLTSVEAQGKVLAIRVAALDKQLQALELAQRKAGDVTALLKRLEVLDQRVAQLDKTLKVVVETRADSKVDATKKIAQAVSVGEKESSRVRDNLVKLENETLKLREMQDSLKKSVFDARDAAMTAASRALGEQAKKAALDAGVQQRILDRRVLLLESQVATLASKSK